MIKRDKPEKDDQRDNKNSPEQREQEVTFLRHFEYDIDCMLSGVEELQRQEPVDEERQEADSLVRYQVSDFIGYPGGYSREKINQL